MYLSPKHVLVVRPPIPTPKAPASLPPSLSLHTSPPPLGPVVTKHLLGDLSLPNNPDGDSDGNGEVEKTGGKCTDLPNGEG